MAEKAEKVNINNDIIKQLNKKSDYKVKLDHFEGPLDLLLHLIKQAKIDIKDIFVSEITSQYISYLDELEEIDMEKAAEFIEVAADLIEIKSRALLPKLKDLMPDEEDPEKAFIQKIEEYKLLKEASEKLKQIESVNRFYKLPDESVGDPRYVLKDMTLDGLLDAFSKLLTRAEMRQDNAPKSIMLERYTVADRVAAIKELLLIRKKANFLELFDASFSKIEIINTFLAMLELLKMQYAYVLQKEIFGEITLEINEENKDKPMEEIVDEYGEQNGD